MSEHIVQKKVYFVIFGLLMVFTALTYFAARVDLGGSLNTVVALTIAVIKATLVVLYFMHVKQASRVTWVFAGAAFLWLAIMIFGTLTDYATRGNQPGTVNELPAVQFMRAEHAAR